MTTRRRAWTTAILLSLAPWLVTTSTAQVEAQTPTAAPAQQAAAANLAPIKRRLIIEIDRILEETGIPAISIALVRDGDIAWTAAFGLANVGAGVAATPDTYFSTGSTFKFVTATAIAQLAERGLLELDTPLNTIVGQQLAIEGADDVSFRHLLSHHSGLEGPVGIVPLWSRRAPSTPLETLQETERVGPPGKAYRYCNECYGIMAWVIEHLTGRDYDTYITEEILEPLGIDAPSVSVPSPAVIEQLALPYEVVRNEPTPIAQVRYDVYAAGDVYLRAEDMARFLAAQLNGGVFRGQRILSEASAREMQRRQFAWEPYGLGTGVIEQAGRTILQHSGAIPGFNSISMGDPSARTGVYIMSNSGSSLRAIEPLARLAMQLLRGEDPPPLPSFAIAVAPRELPPKIDVDPAIFDAYVGDYQVMQGFVLSVSRVGTTFYAQGTGQPRLPIYASSPADFYFEALDADLSFERENPDGPVTHMIYRQGREYRAPKIR